MAESVDRHILPLVLYFSQVTSTASNICQPTFLKVVYVTWLYRQ